MVSLEQQSTVPVNMVSLEQQFTVSINMVSLEQQYKCNHKYGRFRATVFCSRKYGKFIATVYCTRKYGKFIATVYCKFRKFCENFVFGQAQSVKRHICHFQNSRLGHDLPTSVKDSDSVISLVFYFHETSIMRSFMKEKTFVKKSEFTVTTVTQYAFS